jgi:hypothetical protein
MTWIGGGVGKSQSFGLKVISRIEEEEGDRGLWCYSKRSDTVGF